MASDNGDYSSTCAQVKRDNKNMARQEITPSFVVGIDLGTTNSVVAYADLREGQTREIKSLSIPQWTRSGHCESLDLLPSFLFAPISGTHDVACLPWEKTAGRFTAGVFARNQAGLTPSRVVQSAKSWLSHSRVNREAPILPWGFDGEIEKISPVMASSAVLRHLKHAWDHEIAPKDPSLKLEHQDVVVTIPASFDEVARGLTLTAATEAGLSRVTLVEEPQAAFYWWIESHKNRWDEALPNGGVVLVCDIGGGTTDLSLIRISPREDGPPSFERLAVGRHLLLGGDNIDNAMAKSIEQRQSKKLDIRQWAQLVSRCRGAKEGLLRGEGEGVISVQVPGSSSRLIGGSVSVDIPLQELETLLLEGFLPEVKGNDEGVARARAGLMQQGLPYEKDPAITRHILSFLRSQASADDDAINGLLRPSALLFNGGATHSRMVRERISSVVGAWFGEEALPILSNDEPDRAVSMGAATYGLSRRGEGVRIRGGSARAFYVSFGEDGKAMCILPHGTEEGKRMRVEDSRVSARTNEAVAFKVLTSSTRTEDEVGEVIAIHPELEELPPLVTVLEFGKAASREALPVALVSELTPLGTIAVACASLKTPHSWTLEFALSGESVEVQDELPSRQLDEAVIEQASQCVDGVFRGNEAPNSLMRSLETVLGQGREEWSAQTLRALWKPLLDAAPSRERSPEHEMRWFNLAGYCLRPGFGQPGDTIRCKELWRAAYGDGVRHKKSAATWREWWVLWRRVSGGLKSGQQTEILGSAQRLLGGKKLNVSRLGRGTPDKAELQELWMLAGSLERVEANVRIKLGRQALKYMTTEQLVRYGYWVIGRIGTRQPIYAGVDGVLPRKEVEEWVSEVVRRSWKNSAKVAFELAQLGRFTDDRAIDLSEASRNLLIEKVTEVNAEERVVRFLTTASALDTAEQGKLLADSVPTGLVWNE